MGCCLTTTAAGDNSKTKSKTSHPPPPLPPPPPPPPCFEEEKVKEVLSETPVSTSKNPIEETENENGSEVSSEMYSSYTASLSAATTNTTIGTGIEIEVDKDGEEEVTQKLNNPPPVAKMVPRRHPPALSSSQRVRSRKPHPPAPNITTAQRNVVRREPSDRRSRSPAGEGQIRKVKERIPVRKSGNRVPVKVTENEVKVKVKKTDDDDVMPEAEVSESLENPLVSLECFIFL